MLEPLASHLVIGRLRQNGVVVAPPPALADRVPAHRRIRVPGRVVRRLAPLHVRPTRMPAGAFDLTRAHDLPTSQLWGVWTVAHLESGLALRAAHLTTGEDRVRAHRAYRAALEREAGAARLLAERAGR